MTRLSLGLVLSARMRRSEREAACTTTHFVRRYDYYAPSSEMPQENDPASFTVNRAVVGPVGSFMEPVNKLTVFAPYLALFGAIAAVAVVVWKKPRND